jgi:SAM-dependent methyltransferase
LGILGDAPSYEGARSEIETDYFHPRNWEELTYTTIRALPSHPLYQLSPHKMASTSKSSPVETTARERLRQHFQADISQHQSKWDDLYAQNFTPWDIGTPNPALIETLQRSDLIPPSVYGDSEGKVHRKRALVPGCGKGYDVLLLASFGYDAYGLESSPLALEKAKENEKNKARDELYIVRDEQKGKGKVHWLDGDFFKDGWLKDVDGDGDGTFDLIYDYTVCDALHIFC